MGRVIAAIVCRDVHRHFKDVRALDGATLSIDEHQIFGLLGPNGSGKTTLLNQLQGLDRPTAGEVSVLGLNPIRDRDQLAERMGTQLQEATIIPRLTVREAMMTFASFYSRTRDVDELITKLGLATKASARVEELSGGQRQRVFIGLALLNDPELLFFDELTSAVDPQARLAIWEILRELRRVGRTIMLTTHSMAEAQELCDRIAIIDNGKIITEGTPTELIDRHADGSTLRLRTDAPVDIETLRTVAGVKQIRNDGEELTVVGQGQFIPQVIATLSQSGVGIIAMKQQDPTFEDVFLNLTGRVMREGE